MKNTDPKKKVAGGRVYKDSADKARQKKMEGKSTPFQRSLRKAEQSGKTKFTYNGKSYASKPQPQMTKKSSKSVTTSKPKMAKPVMKKVAVSKPKAASPKKVAPKATRTLTGKKTKMIKPAGTGSQNNRSLGGKGRSMSGKMRRR